jgi:glycosyltransferase involved in cell wall biosynthesis
MKSFINEYPLAINHKYCLWMNMPSHHQMDFIKALHEAGVDLQVRFFGKVDEGRIHMGWDASPNLEQYVKYVRPSVDALDESVPDWRERVHIIPGAVGDKFLMALVDHLIREKVNWVHWSEDVKPGLNRLIRLPLRMLYGRKINRYALGALAISNVAKKEFISWGIDPYKIKWLPYAANPLQGSGNSNEQINKFIQNRFVFMFIGKLCHQKGTDLLLQSFKRVSDQYPLAALVLIGPDTADGYYETYSRKLKLSSNRVLFTGAVVFDKIKYMYSFCDVCILPSRYKDGWGMVLYEAASLGKALIATDRCGAAHHIIVDGLNGFMVKSGNVSSLVMAMKRYIESPGLAKLHGAHSKIMAEFFYPGKNVERFLCAMESFLTMSALSRRSHR